MTTKQEDDYMETQIYLNRDYYTNPEFNIPMLNEIIDMGKEPDDEYNNMRNQLVADYFFNKIGK